MAACAYSVWECNDELRAEREGRVVAGARVEETRFRFGPGDRWSTTIYTAAAIPAEGATKGDDMDAALKKEEEAMSFDWDSADEAAAAQAKASLAARQAALYKPRAAYEVHTGQVHCECQSAPLNMALTCSPQTLKTSSLRSYAGNTYRRTSTCMSLAALQKWERQPGALRTSTTLWRVRI